MNIYVTEREQLIAIKEKMISAGIPNEEIDEIIVPLQKLIDRRVCGLVWEHTKTSIPQSILNGEKLPILKPILENNIYDNSEGINHVLIEGDNLLSLMALQYTHRDETKRGLVDVIYIDPPYNTESTTMSYNDKFEKSEWLSMQSIRLKLAHDLLKEDGVIFISIDEHYYSELKLLCDDIFEGNHIGTLHWKKKKQPSYLHGQIAGVMEYILVYGRDKSKVDKLSISSPEDSNTRVDNGSNAESKRLIKKGIRVKLPEEETVIKAGVYKNKTMSTEFCEDVYIVNGRTANDFEAIARFRDSQERIDRFVEEDVLFITKNHGFRRDKLEAKRKQIVNLLLDWGDNQDSDKEIKDIFNTDDKPFDYPKPVSLIKNLIKSTGKKDNAVILDFYAGTGTTAQAVMELNAEDEGTRQVILCTNNELGKKALAKAKAANVTPDMPEWEDFGICHAVTYPRLKTVITGERAVDHTKYSDGLPNNNLYYYKIDDTLEESSIDEITRNNLARQAVSYIALKENVFNLTEEDDYHLLYNDDTEIMVVLDPYIDEYEIEESLLNGVFSKNNCKIYCSVEERITKGTVQYVPYPDEVLSVLQAAKKYIRRETR